MVYQGSKNRISKYLKPIIESYLKNGMNYVEPFVGGANMIDKIEWNHKYGFDNNRYIIALHKELQKRELEYLPDGREHFETIRNIYKEQKLGIVHKNIDDALIGYYGIFFSFNGKFFEGGYCAYEAGGRNRTREKVNNANKQRLNPQYQNIIFETKDFKDLEIKNSVIYLDPPYLGTLQYQRKKFNHNELWEKCKEWSKHNNIILLSELTCPSDEWKEIWNIEINHLINYKKNNKKVVERLFIYEC